MKLFVLVLLVSAFLNLDAQVKQVRVRTNADVTILSAKPDLNLGYDYSNEMCNWDSVGAYGGNDSPEESWIRWDLGSIESEIGPDEEILYVEAVFRVSWNSADTAIAQGYRVIQLKNAGLDFWNEGNGVPGGAGDNLDGLTWNKAKSLPVDFEDPANYDTIMAKKYAGIVPQEEYVDLTQAVNFELGDDGNKILTLRVIPYDMDIANITRKKWLGFISLNSPPGPWNLEVDDEGYPVEAPHLIFYIGKPQSRFSPYEMMGDTSNYSIKPSAFGNWVVEEDEGDLRLIIAKKTSIDTNNWKPAATAIFNEHEFQDFELNFKAKMNYVTPSGAFFPYNDFITIFGYEDEDNFSYFAFYGDDESGTFKVVDGIRTRVGDAKPVPALSDTAYHEYKLSRVGSTITASIDGVEYHSITNDSLNASGKVGMGSHNDVVFFDDFMEKDYSIVTGRRNIKLSTSVNIFPNPAKDILRVQSERNIIQYSIIDIVGKSVVTKNIIGEKNFNVSVTSLPQGIYFMNMKTDREDIIIKRFIKK